MGKIIYLKSETEYPIGEGIVYTEFDDDIATRQINIHNNLFALSSSIKDWNENFGYVLYDGLKTDLDLSDSVEISSQEFEEIWDKLNNMNPKKIKYLEGDASIPINKDSMIIHIVNNLGYWGKGFVLSLSAQYPMAKKLYKDWCKGLIATPFTLGKNQFIQVDNQERIFVVNMLAQDGVKKGNYSQKPNVDYKSLEDCLIDISRFAMKNRLTIQMPKIGAGLSGGEWSIIENIINRTLIYNRIDTYVLTLDNII